MRNIIHRSRAELRRSFESNLQPHDVFFAVNRPPLQSLTSFYGLPARASPFPARRQRCAKIKPARNKHRSFSQTSVKCNRSLLCTGNRSSSFRSKIRCDCSAPSHHRLCTIGSASFIEKSADIVCITSSTSSIELINKKLHFNPLRPDFNNHNF